MLLVDTVERQFMRDEVLKENIFQPETCTEWLDEEVSYIQKHPCTEKDLQLISITITQKGKGVLLSLMVT